MVHGLYVKGRRRLRRAEQDRGGAWSAVCNGACDCDLPLEPMYRIKGGGVRTSGSFHLLGKPGDRSITLHFVDTASSAAFSGGVAMALIGGLAATIGFYGAIIASSNDDEANYDSYDDEETQRHQNTVVPWIVTGLVGAAVGTVGLVMAVSNEKTKISQSGSVEKSAAKLFATKTASNVPDRTPTWANLRPAGVPAADTGTIFWFKF